MARIPRSSWPPPDRSQQRFALLVDSLAHEYEQSVVQGTLVAARELGARLAVVAGGAVNSPEPQSRAANFVFDLVRRDNVLGVLVLSGTLGNATGRENLATWLERYDGLPLCCLGVPITDRKSTQVDNAGGIRAAVEHLLDSHGKHNIGFIRGPSTSHEAEERYAAYRDTLTRRGINPDGRWVADGDYTRSSGAQAVRTILDHKRVSVHALDALVCANDYMALGALDELGRRGINVPEQVALIGFDDVVSAATSRPSLTTVRQPGGDLGREGLKQLLLQAGGARDASAHTLPVELKVRRSCGCAPLEVELGQRQQPASASGSFEAALFQRRQLIVAEVARAAHGSFGAAGSDWENHLLSALIEEMRDGKPGVLSRRLQRLLLKLEQGGGDLTAAPVVLSTLRRLALGCVSSGSPARDRLEDAVNDAQQLAATMLTQAAVSSTRAQMSQARALTRQVHEQMFGPAHLVSQALAEHLPALGVDACVVAGLVDAGDDHDDGLTGFVRFGFAPGKGHPEPRHLPLERVVDHPLVQASRTVFLLPILLGSEKLGVATVSVTTQLGRSDLLDDLRELFSTVLKVTHTRHG
jgi:DNA-binding LacI/PurR family transcriptional regulator